MNDDDQFNDPENLQPVPDYQREAMDKAVEILREHFESWVLAVETGEEDIQAISAFGGPMSTTRGLSEMLRDTVRSQQACRNGHPDGHEEE